MEAVKNHIESITNGNSKGLAYWIAIGVISLVLNWATGVVKIVMESKQPTMAFNDKEILSKQEKQITLLTEIVYQLKDNKKDINNGHEKILESQKNILKEAEKMERYKQP